MKKKSAQKRENRHVNTIRSAISEKRVSWQKNTKDPLPPVVMPTATTVLPMWVHAYLNLSTLVTLPSSKASKVHVGEVENVVDRKSNHNDTGNALCHSKVTADAVARRGSEARS